MPHPWEIDHPYYCTESQYFGTLGRDVHDAYATFAAFLADYADVDKDYNLLVRWDWCEGPDHELPPYTGDDTARIGRLKLYWLLQRKGYHRWTHVQVARNDAPAVLAFLRPFWAHLQELWEGVSDAE